MDSEGILSTINDQSHPIRESVKESEMKWLNQLKNQNRLNISTGHFYGRFSFSLAGAELKFTELPDLPTYKITISFIEKLHKI